ncbi:hypothetical protein AADZ86_15090 [Colwelliaceae bacterium BS250]
MQNVNWVSLLLPVSINYAVAETVVAEDDVQYMSDATAVYIQAGA